MFKKLGKTAMIIGLLLLAAAAVGCGEKAASREGEERQVLRVCSSLGEDLTGLLIRDFVQRQQARAEVAYLPAGTFQERLAYLKNGRFDVWLGGTAEEYYLAHREAALEPYLTREAYKVPVTLRNKDGHWTSLYLGYIGLISNKEKLRRFGLYAPTVWDELLDEKLQDEIAVPDYDHGGASYSMLTSIWQLRGKDKALAYAARFNAQRPQLTAGLAEAGWLVYSGEKTVAVVPLSYAMILEGKHPHLFATIIKDANRNLLTGAALLANAGNKEGARAFLDYLMSDESVELLRENGYYFLWHVKNYPDNVGRKEFIGKVQVPVDDLGWTSIYKSEVIRKWKEAR